jgi:hypothetical protein
MRQVSFFFLEGMALLFFLKQKKRKWVERRGEERRE